MAEASIASAAANTAGKLATECLSPYFKCFFQFGENTKKLKNLRKDLESKMKRLQDAVDTATKIEDIYDDVKLWQENAKEELKEAESLEDQVERCKCFNWCPSWGWRCCLSLKVDKKTKRIQDLLEKDFLRVGNPVPLQGIDFLPSNDYKASKSSIAAFDAIIKALTTDGVNMLGLYGMPGVGKTTLAKEVGKYAIDKELFDKRVMFTMSQTMDISKIQNCFSDILRFEFKAKGEKEKAEELLLKLRDTKILIIIDDVWEKFELKTIGIPNDNENKDCKILLTTRLQLVCGQMGCNENFFELGILDKDEAWALFKDIAGLQVVSSTENLIAVAKELADECHGLPLAINTVANALKVREVYEWEAANRRLKDARHSDNERVTVKIYKCLELSYDYLKGENTKSCLLLCSLFPEDYDIPINQFALIGIGEGLFCNIDSIEEQRREIYLALTELQQSGLLLQIDDERNTLRMHDVVRDFAHWLTNMRGSLIMVKDKLMKLPMSANFESHTAIAMWNLKMNPFPRKLEFKKLKTLILFGDGMLTIPATMFEGMKALLVLWLQYVEFSLEALGYLTNLRALLLDDVVLKESIAPLENVENWKIEILFVNDVHMEELSEEFGRLQYVKYLYLKNINTPSNFVARLATSLQEVHVLGAQYIKLWELSSFSCFTKLTLGYVGEHFPEGFVFPKLQSYVIRLSNQVPFERTWRRLTMLGCSSLRRLELSGCSSLSPIKTLFCNMEEILLYYVSEVRYIISNGEGRELLNELTSLHLEYCQDLEYLIEPTKNQHHHHHAIAITCLQSLKVVRVYECGELKSIFIPCVSHNLLHLQRLSIYKCAKLEQVFGFAEDDAQITGQQQENQVSIVLSNLTYLELRFLSELRCIWEGSTHLINLSSLKTIEIWDCDKLTYLFSSSLAQTLVHLEDIIVKRCKDLEYLILTKGGNGGGLCWPKLNTVKIEECRSLKVVFSNTLPQGFPALKNIKIVECVLLEHVFDFAEDAQIIEQDQEGNQQLLLSNLLNFELRDLPNLRSIWTETTHLVNLSILNTLQIQNCDKLAYIFSSSLAQTLVHLENIKIVKCVLLEHVFDFAEDAQIIEQDQEGNQQLLLSNLLNFELRDLPNLRSIWTETTHLVNLSILNTLQIQNCDKLAYLFSSSLAQTLVHLENMSIDRCKDLEHLILTKAENGGALCWPKLKTVEIKQCKSLKVVFSNTLPEELPALKNIKIVDCSQLKQVFDFAEHVQIIEQNQGRALSNLTNLELIELPELRSIWAGSTHLVNLSSLNTLKIKACEELACLFSRSLAQTLLHLEYINIDSCKGLEHLISLEAEHRNAYLKLECLPNLGCIWKGPTHFVNLSSLKDMQIWNCDKMTYLFPSSIAKTLVHLECLEIGACKDLEHLILVEAKNGEAFRWSKLSILKIECCESLKDVFTISLAQGLPSLNYVRIDECPQLLGHFSMAIENEQLPNHLQFLESQSFTDLNHFSLGDYFANLPSLEEFKFSEDLRFNYQAEKLDGIWHNWLTLKDDKLNKFEGLIYRTYNLCLCRIEDKNIFPYLTKALNNLNSLEIQDSYELECLIDALLVHDVDDLALPLSNLLNLALSHLDGLKCLWKGPIHKDSLQSLTLINISYCCALKYMFSASLAQSLVQLQVLHITFCNLLEHIILESESDSEIEPHCAKDVRPFLPHLQDLYLENLENLSGFSSKNSPISLSFLNNLRVHTCPRLVNFSIKKIVNEQVQLKILIFSESGYDVNNSQLKLNSRNLEYATILEIFQTQDEQLLSKVEYMELMGMHQLRGPIQIRSLPYLRKLKVWQCNGLKSLFSPLLARNLPQLTLLEIHHCNELEEIIKRVDKTSTSSSASSAQAETRLPHISFPNLKSLHILHCNNLKSLFPVSVILSKIESIIIYGGPKLEHFFKYEAELDVIQDDQNQKKIVLPSLTVFQFDGLSCLRSLAPMGYHLLFPSCSYWNVIESAMLTPGFIRDSERELHGITQEGSTTRDHFMITELLGNMCYFKR